MKLRSISFVRRSWPGTSGQSMLVRVEWFVRRVALLALLAIASAVGPAAAQNVVGPQPVMSILTVGPHATAGQEIVGVRGPPLRPIVSATSVAADTAGTSVADDLATACANSFTADTPVTLADGKQEPISKVKVGDKVVATDPYTGQTKAEPVVALIRHSGEHAMVLVTLADGSVLDATGGHKIWVATRRAFVDASGLHVGDKIETDTGALITVAGLTTYSADLTAYNLQIDQIHTYYAGTTPVLVHNSCTAASVLQDPSAVESLTPSQVDDLARNAGYDVQLGKAGAANPATRYYLPGTNGSVGFRVLPGGVAGQAGVKGGAYLKFFGGANNGLRVPLS